MTPQSIHPLEDPTSWKLFQQRLDGIVVDDADFDDADVVDVEDSDFDAADDQHHRHLLGGDIMHPLYSTGKMKRKKHKKRKTPLPDSDTVHAMMIDAGSQGTRIHIYEYDRRLLSSSADIIASSNGEKLSFPTTNSRWTNKFTPGLDSLAEYVNISDVDGVDDDDEELLQQLRKYLGPLIDFARDVLSLKSKEWKNFPIYLKATGGMRELPTAPRVRIIKAVRQLFHDDEFNPFSFEDERARVISGEEEAIYGWTAVNFAKGSLIETSLGTGTVLHPNNTIGMVEMGGASTQIGLYLDSGDVMANLFKLQIGGARHWNVYVHSFLFFGVNSAYARLNARLVSKNTTVNPCLPAGSAVVINSWLHLNDEGQFLPRSSPNSTEYEVKMMNNPTNETSVHEENFNQCSALTYSLLRKDANNDWVVFSHDGDCSFAGVYQPPLPINNNGIDEYIATGNYADVFAFLKLGESSSVSSINDAARHVCSLSWGELQAYNKKLSDPISDPFELEQYCFRAVFVYQILHNGYGFPDDSHITAVDVLNGRKLTWALGSILYEINTLPWEFHEELRVREPRSKKTKSSKNRWNLLEMAPGSVSGPHDTIGDDSNSVVPIWAFALTFFVVLATFSIVTTFNRRRWNRRRRNQYESLGSTTLACCYFLLLAGPVSVSSSPVSSLSSVPMSLTSTDGTFRSNPPLAVSNADYNSADSVGISNVNDLEGISTAATTATIPARPKLSKSLLCIRHGISVANEFMARPGNQWGDATFRDDPTLIDAPLSQSGRQMTEELLHHQLRTQTDIQEFLSNVELIIISPLTRCLQTYQVGVEPVLAELGVLSRLNADTGEKISVSPPVIAVPLIRERVYTASDTGRDISTLHQEFPRVNFDECVQPDDGETTSTAEKSVQQQAWWYNPTTTDKSNYVEWRPYGQGQWYAVPGEPEDVFENRMVQFDEWLSDRPEKNILIVAHWGVLRHMSGGTEWKNAEAKLVQWEYCSQSKRRTTIVE
mmetsp:Transcript_45633/g.111139  ORF Transcript_45633/g.111139 Transcript_45633/m.111139 type:complete len:997 (+) Transcript_45633:180-3170(+)